MANYLRHTIESTGGAINDTFGPVTSPTTLDMFTVHVSAAPTTSEYFTLTLDSAAGAAFDAVIYKVDLSAASTTDIFNTSLGLLLVPGDALRTTYTNTDGRTIGVQYLMR